jgi:tRNA (cmo5U34)-methyltransferase
VILGGASCASNRPLSLCPGASVGRPSGRSSTVIDMGDQFHFHPSTYLEMVRAEIPGYDQLQVVLAEATQTVEAHTILDLGSGTGVTAERVLGMHPGAHLVGIDSSNEMLAHARQLVPTATFALARLQDPLPPGQYDLVVSAFAIHHLDGRDKADLFRRVASALRLGGRFAFCDVVDPERPVPHMVPLDDGFDMPSTLQEQVAWLADAGLDPLVIYEQDDLCVLAGDRTVE